MINVQEATDIILSHLYKPGRKSVPVDQACGLVLAESISADRDLPPFDRVTMDGIAIQYHAYKGGHRKFLLEGMQAAGEPQKSLINKNAAIEVMTGAMLPAGTDTVIRYEDLTVASGHAAINNENVEAGQSIHFQGQDAKRGLSLLSPGIIVSPAEIALLASVGKTHVEVYEHPKTAIVASGDELVDINTVPLAHQIRRSNTYAIEAAMKAMLWPGKQFHFRDIRQELNERLGEMIRSFDVIILSGGVSQGKLDFIPAVMEEIGVKKLFHQVSQRPGKPFWFGVSNQGKAVFALPGNPVSTYMCFYRYIRPWLLKSMGCNVRQFSAILAKDFTFQPKLTYFLQVGISIEEGRIMAYPDAGGGSGDFANLKKVDGFLELPAGRSEFRAGESFQFIPFRL